MIVICFVIIFIQIIAIIILACKYRIDIKYYKSIEDYCRTEIWRVSQIKSDKERAEKENEKLLKEIETLKEAIKIKEKERLDYALWRIDAKEVCPQIQELIDKCKAKKFEKEIVECLKKKEYIRTMCLDDKYNDLQYSIKKHLDKDLVNRFEELVERLVIEEESEEESYEIDDGFDYVGFVMPYIPPIN